MWFSVTPEEQKMPDLSIQTYLSEESSGLLWTKIPDIMAPLLSNDQEAIDLLLQYLRNRKQCHNPALQERGVAIP